jgi:predicted RecA/RadA family phage recombinase
MVFNPKDVHIYDELLDITPAAAVAQGDAVVIQDVFGFYLVDVTTEDIANARNEVAFVYRMRQVEVAKMTGTGEAIQSGDKIYYQISGAAVTANPVGVAGTDYYFCGWAKKNASASASVVLINFDGTRYNENI